MKFRYLLIVFLMVKLYFEAFLELVALCLFQVINMNHPEDQDQGLSFYQLKYSSLLEN